MDTQIVELLGRNQLVDELLRAGLEVAVPLRDRGVDLVVYADLVSETPAFAALPIQVKASSSQIFSVDRKYDRLRNLVLAFVWNVRTDEDPVTYGLTYPEAVGVAKAMGWTRTKSWREGGVYTTTRPSKRLRDLLERFRMSPARWWAKLSSLEPALVEGSRSDGIGA